MASDKYIAEQANKTGDNTAQLGRKGISFSTLPTLVSNTLEIWDCRYKYSTQQEGSVFVVGHPIYSMMGPSTTPGAMPVGLNNTTRIETYVYNSHGLFPEYFDNDRFLALGSSTGSWYEAESAYYVDNEEYLLTEYIAYEDKTYKSIKVKVDCEDVVTGSNAIDNIDITAIINGSEYPLDNNTTTVIGNTSSDGLKVKLTNNVDPNAVVFPMTFPITFDGEDVKVKIKEFNVTYSE